MPTDNQEGKREPLLFITNHREDCGQAIIPGPDTCNCPPPSAFISVDALAAELEKRIAENEPVVNLTQLSPLGAARDAYRSILDFIGKEPAHD